MVTCNTVARWIAGAALFALLAGTQAPVHAEEVKNRWRFDVQIGGLVPGGKILSTTSQTQTLQRSTGVPEFVSDFRYLGFNAEARGKLRVELHASYGLFSGRSSEVLLDVGIGYYQTLIDGIELSYAFDSVNPYYRQNWPGCETRLARGFNGAQLDGCTWWDARSQASLYSGPRTNPTRVGGAVGPQYWTIESVEGGKLTVLPVSLNVLIRYRPTKRFNPYIGGGVGYLFAELDESARWRQISDELEGSLVSDVTFPENRSDLTQRKLAEFIGVGHDTDQDGSNDRVEVLQLGHLMKRPKIDAPDTPYLEARAGVEMQFSPKWAFVMEGKYFWAKDDILITADGQEKFGQPIPSVTIPYNTPVSGAPSTINPDAFPEGGKPAYIINGGLRQPAYNPDLPPDSSLVLDGEGNPVGIDGQPGQYYLNGGRLKYGGWVFTVGVRYTL